VIEFVADCSTVLSWFFEDEESRPANSCLDLLADGRAYAPAILTLEVANVLQAAEIRGRVSRVQALLLITRLNQLPITIDSETTTLSSIETLLSVAKDYQLSAYDAAYLELALRKLMPLATCDRKLSEAARQAGITLLG